MSKKRLLIQSLIGGAVLALTLKGLAGRLTQAASASKRASSGRSFEEIDAFVKEQMKSLNIPGAALAIVEGQAIVHRRGFGQARPGGEVPAPQTPFFIGSLTKSITALAVMQLVEAGKVELDAPLQRYLPWFRVADPLASAQMTVRHLLNQTSGLSNATGSIPLADLDDRPGASERQARALSTFRLTRPVGAAFEYSNMNYNLLGLVIEAASGEGYAAYIQNHVFAPLDMRHSTTRPAEAVQNGLAAGHRYWFWRPVPTTATDLPVPQGSLASGQLVSCAEDMAHYLIAHLNEGRYACAQILSPAGIAELHRPAVAAYAMGPLIGQYGMGWFNEVHGQTRLVWHHGQVPDYASYMALLPEQQKGLILLINADHFMMNPIIAGLGSGVALRLAGQPSELLRFGVLPWLIRALLLIPLLQIVDVAATLRQISRWHREPALRPSRGRLWGQHILLPLIPNLLLAAVPVYLLASKMLGFMLLFFADFAWVTLICGGFAGLWTFLRTRLILGTLRKPS